MSHLDEQIAEALAHGPDTLTCILAQALTTARARVAELEARRVVVPEPTCDEWRSIAENARSADMVDFLAGAAAYGLWLRGKIPCSIPADRVLGEGERKVGSEEWMYLSAFERYARKHGPESIQDVVECLDHLRANQGGAAT